MQPILSIALFSVLLPYSLTAAASTNCFEQQGDYVSVPAPNTERISVGVACPQSETNKTCPLATGGKLTEPSTLNITTTGSLKELFDVIGAATGTEFAESLTGSVHNTTYQVESGRTGYYGFTQTYLCYSGVLKDCVKDVKNGTAVRACRPATRQNKKADELPELDGTVAFVNTDSISNLTTNPANTSEKSGPAASPSSQANLGMTVIGQGGLVMMTVVLGLLTWFGL